MSDNELSNFASDIEKVAGAEPIEAIVISVRGLSEGYGEYDRKQLAEKAPDADSHLGEVLAWDEARSMLDYNYDAGYGGVECHAIYAWTASKVIFVSTYDGSTSVDSVPRHPTAGLADIFGGG